MRLSLGKKVALGFGATLAILSIIVVGSYRATTSLIENSAWVEHTHTVLEKIENVLSTLKDVETGWRGYVVTGQEEYLQPTAFAQESLSRDLRDLRSLTSDNGAQQLNLDRLEHLVPEKMSVLEQMVTLRRAEGLEAAVEYVRAGNGKAVMDQIRRVVQGMTEIEKGLLVARDQSAAASARNAIHNCALAGLLAFGLAALSGVLIRRDFTMKRAAEEALRRSEESLARIVETVADGLVIAERDGRLSFANAAAERILGVPRGAVIQRTYDDAAWGVTTLDGKPFPAEELPVARVLKENAPVYGVELAVRRFDGSRTMISCNAAPLRDAKGSVIGVVASLTDISRRKEVERLKDDFVSTVSHELRTPLSSLRGFAELMLTRNFSLEKQREFLGIIHDEAVRLTNLINDFLDIQRMESGRQMYEFKPVDLVVILAESVTLFSQGEGKHQVSLEMPGSLPRIWADPARVRQVVSNLISNAVKFSPEESKVTVRAFEENGSVVTSVSDQGVGIPAEAMGRLFSKFFRAENAAARNIAGTGLGLALVKEIVEAHLGGVRVKSELGKGSTFFFSLPVAHQPAKPPPGPASTGGGRIDVLLVEDDAAFSRLLCEHFEADGLRICATSKGEEALNILRQSSPRLALLDIHLEGRLDGWDLLVHVKSDPELRSIPILIISASDTINARGLAVGGADYLLKPVSPAWLLQSLRRQLLSLSGKRVLLVDDDAVFRRQVREWLAPEEGLELTEAGDGREALGCMAARMPDLLILDLLMPEMDGFELLTRLRADKRAVNLPVLVITGKDLSPEDKGYLKRRMGTLVRKREVSLEHIAKVVQEILAVSCPREEEVLSMDHGPSPDPLTPARPRSR
jgi:PAS domain S-box-containing protein